MIIINNIGGIGYVENQVTKYEQSKKQYKVAIDFRYINSLDD